MAESVRSNSAHSASELNLAAPKNVTGKRRPRWARKGQIGEMDKVISLPNTIGVSRVFNDDHIQSKIDALEVKIRKLQARRDKYVAQSVSLAEKRELVAGPIKWPACRPLVCVPAGNEC